MLKKLLSQLFDKLENEKDNDKRSKNGNSNYFVEQILEVKFGKPNFISARALKDYYDKYVKGKGNNAGEPSIELKDLIALYLGFENYHNFEIKNKNENRENKKGISYIKNRSVKSLLIVVSIVLASGVISYNTVFKSKDCIEWKVDHYEEIECLDESPNPLLKDLNIKTFNKIEVNDSTTFFAYGHPKIWYGKSDNGEIEYFNSRGLHPVTLKELRPISEYIIKKYIQKTENKH